MAPIIFENTMMMAPSGAPNILSPVVLPAGTQGVPYSYTLLANGGQTPYTWSITSGTLDSGVTLNPVTGVISGTPANAETDIVTFKVTDARGLPSSKIFNLLFVASGSPLDISTTSPLPAGTQNQPYNFTMTATGGIAPYTWAITVGSLAAGLNFSSAGVFSGTTASIETDNITIRVTDSALTPFSKSFSLSINAAGSNRLEGTSVQEVSYFNNDFPFVNVLKQASSNDPCPWVTYPTNGHGGNVVLDASQYPTTMTGADGEVFTALEAWVFVNVPTVPGASANYPPGPYRFQFTGIGSLSLNSGFTSITSISNTGIGTSTFSGLNITSPTTGVTTVTAVTNNSTGGLRFRVTAIPDSANNPRNMSLVQVSKATAYDAGQIYSDYFVTMLQNYTSVRTKDWLKTDTELLTLYFGGVTVPAGATSATMQTWNGTAWVLVPWEYPTGNYLVSFTTNQQIVCSMVWNSATLTIPPGALTQDVVWDSSSHFNPQAWYSKKGDWAHRTKFTDFTWANDAGVPYEVCWQLPNILNSGAGIDTMWSVPVRAGIPTGMDMTYVNGLANLSFNGTGTTMPGFTGIIKKQRIEFSNEGWNSGNPYDAQRRYAIAMSLTLCPGASDQAVHEYRGAMQAIIGDTFFSVFGATQYAARVWSSYGGQTAWSIAGGASSWGPYYTIRGMNSPHWAGGPAYTHHIDAVHFAPYVGMNAATDAPSSPTTNFTAPPTGTSGVLTSSLAVGSYKMFFSDGQTRMVTQAVAGTSVSWTGALTGTPTTAAYATPARLIFTAPPTGTSAVIASIGGTAGATLAAGTYLITFSDNQLRNVTLASASTTITWTGALTGSPTTWAQTGDTYAIASQTNALDILFGIAYSNVYQGITYPSVGTVGWVGLIINQMLGQLNAFIGQPWWPIPVFCYESGTDFAPQTTDLWGLLCIQIHYDPRMEFIYHDPQRVLFNTYGYTAAQNQPGYLISMRDVCNIVFMHQLTDTGVPSKFGEYGAVEGTLQNLTSFATMPAKYRGIQKYLQGL